MGRGDDRKPCLRVAASRIRDVEALTIDARRDDAHIREAHGEPRSIVTRILDEDRLARIADHESRDEGRRLSAGGDEDVLG